MVTGQRMLQSATDVFVGWTHDDEGHFFYFRQLRDMRMKIDIAAMNKQDWLEYVEICGWALARAHARTGDSQRIAGYLGKHDAHSTKRSPNLQLPMPTRPTAIMRRS